MLDVCLLLWVGFVINLFSCLFMELNSLTYLVLLIVSCVVTISWFAYSVWFVILRVLLLLVFGLLRFVLFAGVLLLSCFFVVAG